MAKHTLNMILSRIAYPPHQIHVHSEPGNVTGSGNRAFTDIIKLRWGHVVQSNYLCFYKRKMCTQTQMWRSCADGGRDWNDASISQGMPCISNHLQELGERHGIDLLVLPKRINLANNTWFQTSGHQNCDRTNFCYFKPQSLWQCVMAVLKKTNILLFSDCFKNYFSLPLVFCSFTVFYVTVDFFRFILLGIHWISWNSQGSYFSFFFLVLAWKLLSYSVIIVSVL